MDLNVKQTYLLVVLNQIYPVQPGGRYFLALKWVLRHPI